jgi:hypothetical protein
MNRSLLPKFHFSFSKPSKLKLDEEKLKHAGLAQQNGFGPTVLREFAQVGKSPLEKASYQRANSTSNNGIGNKGQSLGVMLEISKVRIT